MDMLVAIGGGMAVLLLIWPLLRLRSVSPAVIRARRAHQMAWSRRRRWTEALGPILGLAEADRLCQYAGRPGNMTGVTLLQYQFLFAFLCFWVFSLAGMGIAFPGAFFAWFIPRLLLSSMAQQRRSRIALELPAFLDLWGLLVASGEGVETALAEICRRHPDWTLTDEVQRVLERVSASGLFGESLVEEARVTGSQELVTVAEEVSHLADGGGVPSRELARMAELMRDQRVSELMQSAGTMAIMGIFPKLGAIFLSLAPVVTTIILTVMKNVT